MKVIKLNESDIQRIVKRVLTEQVKKKGDKYELEDGEGKGFSFEITSNHGFRQERVDSSKGYFKKMGMKQRSVHVYGIKIINSTKSLCDDGLCEGDKKFLETYRGSHGKYEWKIGSFIQHEDEYKKI